MNRIMGIKNKEINLNPINKLTSRIEKVLTKRKTWKDRSHIDELLNIEKEAGNLNSNQQKYFTNYLINKISEYYDLFLSAIENSEDIQNYKKLIKSQKKKIKS